MYGIFCAVFLPTWIIPSLCSVVIHWALLKPSMDQGKSSSTRWCKMTFRKATKMNSNVRAHTHTHTHTHTLAHTHQYIYLCIYISIFLPSLMLSLHLGGCQVSDFLLSGWMFWTLDRVTGTFPSPGVGDLVMGLPVMATRRKTHSDISQRNKGLRNVP